MALRTPIFAGNWKMHHGPTDARAFLRSFLVHYARRPDRTVMLFPPSATLPAVVDALRDRLDIVVGVQNIHGEDKGAFTGEISAPIARDAGARYTLVGHSERRHVFGESDEVCGKKVAAAIRGGLGVILCVGEKLEEREAGEAESVVVRQLTSGLAGIDPAAASNLIIAYEPVWAIGTGKNATPDDARVMHAAVRAQLLQLMGEKGKGIPILYGGSVNRGNVESLMAAPGVDGVLVGGASLDAESWASIVRA